MIATLFRLTYSSVVGSPPATSAMLFLQSNLLHLRQRQWVLLSNTLVGQHKWKKVIDSFKETDMFTLVPYQPNMNIIGCKWLGTTNQFKCWWDIEKSKSTSGSKWLLIMKRALTTWKPIALLLNSHSNIGSWYCYFFSVGYKAVGCYTDFLHGEFTKTVYMHQPRGFIDKDNPVYVCKINKAI